MTLPTDQEFLELFRNGQLARAMADRFARLASEDQTGAIPKALARLHNTGQLDLLNIVEAKELQALVGSRFFSAAHLLGKVIPELEVEPGRLVEIVERMVALGGDDGAANMPNGALKAWCAKDPARSEALIAVAGAGDARAVRALTFPLEALGDPSRARSLLASDRQALWPSAITALGRIGDPHPNSQAQSLAAISGLIDVADDELKPALFSAVIHLLGQPNAEITTETNGLLDRLLEDADDQMVHFATRAIWTDPVGRDPRILPRLLATARTIKPMNKGTLLELDLALTQLLDGGQADEALEFVEAWFSQDDDTELETLKSFVSKLVNGPLDILSKATCRWLLMGIPRLCEGLSTALHRGADGAPLLDLARDLQALPAAHQVLVCRKAIAWFFIKPRTAASVLVSCLRDCDELTREAVTALLVHPLLVNYSGVRDYLVGLESDDPAKAAVDVAVAEGDAYIQGLRGVPELRAFFPTEHQRRVQRLRQADQTRDIAEQARKQSVFFGLIKRSVILYGRRSLSYQRGPDGDLQKFEMELTPHGVEFEFPRMEIVDPIGLDYLLRLYRAEALVE